jgi:hypothetical protein
MHASDITAENIAKAVGGKVERDGNILCCCPIHEASGTHNPSLLLTITDTRRILFHCRSQNCDAQHFQTIRNHLVKNCGLPRSHVGHPVEGDCCYNYQASDRSMFDENRGSTKWEEASEVLMNYGTMVGGRPRNALLYNLAAAAGVLPTRRPH